VSKIKTLEETIKKGIREIKGDSLNETQLKNIMNQEYDVLSGVTRKLILTQDLSEFSISMKYMFANALYKILKEEEYNFKPFYNNKMKLLFLQKYPNNTQNTYSRIFEKSKEYEEKYKKDLCEFSISQIEDVLFDLEPLTQSASHVNGRIITAYIDWCILNKNIAIENELKNQPMAWFNQFVDKDIQLYYTEASIRKIEEDCANYQDMVIVRLLFEGVSGKSLSEIRNLRKNDINYETGEVTLVDEDGTTRPFVLSDRAIYLIEEANKLDIYFKKNGFFEDESVGLETNLVDNSYVIRTSITRTNIKDQPVDKMVIYRRIQTISETLGYPALNPKNIIRSGVINKGKEIMEDKNKDTLDKEEYIEICKLYKMNEKNWYPIKKYCNPDIIKKLYKKITNSNYAMV
jgi:integrase